MLGILTGTDLKYICSGMYKAGFLIFLHLALFCPRRTGKLNYLGMACFFLRPLVFGCHLFERFPEEYRVAYFREMTPGIFVFSTLLGSTADTCLASVFEAFEKNFTLSYVKGGLSDPEVDPRLSDCKLWTLRSCSSSLSSTSLSLRTGRFPWSLRFSSCSTLTRWSTSVVQVSSHARCVHRQMPWSMSSRRSSTVVDVAVMPQRPVPAVNLNSWNEG